MAHCVRQNAKGSMGAFIYLFSTGKFNTNCTNPPAPHTSNACIPTQLVGKPVCSYTYSGFIWKTNLHIKNHTVKSVRSARGSKQEIMKPALYFSSAVVREGFCD